MSRLRAPASLLALTASYVARRPRAAFPAAQIAWRVGTQVRKAPILRVDRRLLAEPAELVPVVSLISDTHLVAAGRTPCELEQDPEQWPHPIAPTRDHLVDGVRRLLEHVADHSPRTVVWCGDEVDSGDPVEWRQWRIAVAAVPDLAHRVVPGNHDICFNRPFDEDYDLARRALREAAFQRNAGSLAEFPLVDTIIGDAGPITIILLDSCRHRSTHVLSNAIGYFGADQLASLARTLDRTSGPVLCIAHHHVWRDETFMKPDEWYNTAVDADVLAGILQHYRRRAAENHVMVCHGHRHVLTAGWIGDPKAPIAIVGLPSSTLGDKAGTGRLDGILRYGVAGLRPDGSWAVALHEVGELIPSRVPDRDPVPPR
ncbi:MAG TPA: metallophosphoesterase [Kofleriaceae bacterium]